MKVSGELLYFINNPIYCVKISFKKHRNLWLYTINNTVELLLLENMKYYGIWTMSKKEKFQKVYIF
jgi:hypothetical protein